MPVDSVSLEAKIRDCWPDATHAQVFDVSGGCGDSYEVIIVSPSFAGKTTLKKHREVNDKLKDEIAQLHAFTQKTFTPEQFENVKIVTQ
ncbi:bolA family protein [Rhodotorula toruloides]|uniref:BolA family protein n=1 Tax=Rhodotorula toruloides TaxID=5286 RepID=A0A511K9L2_RHOTO|nr:bolA family protein [Rhodotorula toruloides]